MAKNKNRQQSQPKHQSRSGSAEQAQPKSTQDQAEERLQQASPSDMAHKGRQKRFGHN
ncbi:hypothetical protein [Streptomyces sp. NPDC006879]|uniref:hypothetical protein n=1 Tax=Streptomyces sp. NPDC006879 TaxID=3364767 RepID=UPI0036C83FDD